MSEPITSENFVAICLLAVDGDVHASLLDVVGQVERYQTSYDRHFGNSVSDFRSGLFWLLDENGYGIQHGRDSLLGGLTLHDWVFKILDYEEFYCNDEGEHWIKRRHPLPPTSPFERFFTANPNPSREAVKSFLNSIGKNAGLFSDHSREGCSS